jgi:hypothetical protein
MGSKPAGDARGAATRAGAGRWDCVLIFGYGKSGTKRLLRTLDLSPTTHCRNEPYNLSGSPWQRLRTLPRGYIVRPTDDELLRDEWDGAVDWCRHRMGERDRLPPPPKAHLHPLARRLGVLRLLGSRTARRVAGLVVRDLRRDEWLLPAWAGDRALLEQALVVLKINQSPGFACWVLRNRPTNKVIHIVRHPAGVLHSWSRRFLRDEDDERVRRNNIDRLELIARTDGGWAERFGDIGRMTVAEAEMWFWLYVTEVTHAAGEGSEQYHLVLDEDMMQKPVDVARTLYRECAIPWAQSVEDVLLEHASAWRACAAPWRDLLDADQVSTLEEILGSSPLRDLWSQDQLVSRIDYA